MPTIKKRVNITVSDDMGEILRLLAKRDGVPEATKAGELLKKAVELEEDEIWNMIAEKRATERKTKKLKLIPYEDVFGAYV